MKVFISADIEGVAGIAAPEECNPEHKDYPRFAQQMTREVAAACAGALAAGASDVLVKDAHWTGRNIDHAQLPAGVRMLRNWSGHPFMMMDGLERDHVASAYVGYHSRAGSNSNPLAHTISGGVVFELRINEVPASEFRINSLTAQMLGVPPVFLSGDAALCEESRGYYPGLSTIATLVGKGTAVVARHPQDVIDSVREGVERAIRAQIEAPQDMPPFPEEFAVEVEFKRPVAAYEKSFYPGASLLNERIVRFVTTDWFEALRMMSFVIK